MPNWETIVYSQIAKKGRCDTDLYVERADLHHAENYIGNDDVILRIRAQHATVFLCFVAMKAGIATIDEVLGDYGLLHQVIHVDLDIANGGLDDTVKELQERARSLRIKLENMDGDVLAKCLNGHVIKTENGK